MNTTRKACRSFVLLGLFAARDNRKDQNVEEQNKNEHRDVLDDSLAHTEAEETKYRFVVPRSATEQIIAGDFASVTIERTFCVHKHVIVILIGTPHRRSIVESLIVLTGSCVLSLLSFFLAIGALAATVRMCAIVCALMVVVKCGTSATVSVKLTF